MARNLPKALEVVPPSVVVSASTCVTSLLSPKNSLLMAAFMTAMVDVLGKEALPLVSMTSFFAAISVNGLRCADMLPATAFTTARRVVTEASKVAVPPDSLL